MRIVSLRLPAAILLSCVFAAFGQNAPPVQPESLESLRGQMQELKFLVEEMRKQLTDSRGETDSLRREVQALRQQVQNPPPPSPDLADDQRLLAAKVADQSQTKVGSGSRYQVELSGMALMNGFTTRGAVDNLDLPETARAVAPGESGGSTGATLRQSTIGLSVTGPQWGGAKTSGEIKFDFFGGFPITSEGVTSGLVRLRTAKINFDWKNTSIVAGQDALFFSPLSPTSLVSAAYPSLASAGNLWTWTPQVYVERRMALGQHSHLSLQGGVLDPLTGELPRDEYDRQPTAGERSRMPAYAARIAVQNDSTDRPRAFGVGSYYSRQNWGFGRTVDAWAATADWNLPLGRWFAVSGEFYRGRSLGGLGGGATGGMVFTASGALLPVESLGGWSQVKFKPSERWQFNAAFGKDGSFGDRLERGPLPSGLVRRNASGLFNVIFQPRGNLLFSLEYRRLWTSRFFERIAIADHFGMGVAILF